MLPSGEDDLLTGVRQIYEDHWSSIRTHHRMGHIQDLYNYCIDDMNLHSLVNPLQQLFRNQNTHFKVNVSYGFILQNIETEELQYYHSSQNQG